MKDTAINVLKILEESPGPISGEQIAENLGVTRSAVWKQIRELRRLGYNITSSRAQGYRLMAKTDRLLPYEIHKNFALSSSESRSATLIALPQRAGLQNSLPARLIRRNCTAW